MESEVPLLQQVEGQKSEFAEALSALKSDSAATIKDVEVIRVRFTG